MKDMIKTINREINKEVWENYAKIEAKHTKINEEERPYPVELTTETVQEMINLAIQKTSKVIFERIEEKADFFEMYPAKDKEDRVIFRMLIDRQLQELKKEFKEE